MLAIKSCQVSSCLNDFKILSEISLASIIQVHPVNIMNIDEFYLKFPQKHCQVSSCSLTSLYVQEIFWTFLNLSQKSSG